jgi:hypothetical protein
VLLTSRTRNMSVQLTDGRPSPFLVALRQLGLISCFYIISRNIIYPLQLYILCNLNFPKFCPLHLFQFLIKKGYYGGSTSSQKCRAGASVVSSVTSVAASSIVSEGVSERRAGVFGKARQGY